MNRLTFLLLLALPLSVHAFEIVPRSVGSGANQAYLYLQFPDAAEYVFDVHFDANSVTTQQMVDTVAAQLPLTYTTQWGDSTLYGVTYDGHSYQDWTHGFWSLWFSSTGAAPWTYAQTGWTQLTASNGQAQGLGADLNLDPNLTYRASPTPVTLVSSTGDFNADGKVDGVDFLIWQSNYPNSTGTATQWHGDANGDGKVDGVDFLAWQSHYHLGGTTPTPEPVTASLLVLGALALARAPRRA